MINKETATRPHFSNPDTAPAVILLNWALCLMWMGVIYYFADVPDSYHVTGQYLGGMNYFIRKWAHLAEYGVLMILTFRAVRSLSNAGWMSYATALGITFFYALLDEHHQSMVVGRSSSLGDVAVDTAGALLALALLLIRKSSD
jgi:VanZ family protein